MNIRQQIAANATFLLIHAFSLLLLVSCNDMPGKIQDPSVSTPMTDSVAEYNHQVVTAEIQEINDYILRYHWEMKTTQTGLRFMIYKKSAGCAVMQGDIVGINYKVSLLNGDFVDQSDSAARFTFEAGKGAVVNGLEEGIMLMKQGERAKLIVPSHLAFGLLGDMKKIPARAVLVYDVELRTVNRLKK